MNSDTRDHQDIIQYIQQLTSKTSVNTNKSVTPTPDLRQQLDPQLASHESPSHHNHTDLPAATPPTPNLRDATGHDLGDAINNAIQSSISNWFASHPNVVDDAVYQKVESMVHQLIQEEVRSWINKHLSQYVKSAVQELITTLKNPGYNR